MQHQLCCFPSVLLGMDSESSRVYPTAAAYRGLPEVAPGYVLAFFPPSTISLSLSTEFSTVLSGYYLPHYFQG